MVTLSRFFVILGVSWALVAMPAEPLDAAAGQGTILVIGAVKNPGRVEFAIGTGIDLSAAISKAGGLLEGADPARIEIKKIKGEAFQILTVDLAKQKEIALLDKDTVIVRSKIDAKMVTVLGQVKKPGNYPMLPGRVTDILTAINMAGGATPMAFVKRVFVTHAGGERETVRLDRMQRAEIPALILKPGDIVYVPECMD